MTDTMTNDIDLSQFEGMAPVVQLYLDHVAKVNALDEQMGLASPSTSFWAGMRDANPAAVKQAQQIVEQVNAIEDPTARAIVSQMLRTDRGFLTTSEQFAKDNAPKEEAQKVSAEKLGELYTARSEAQKIAANFFNTIEMIHPDKLHLLPPRPEGRKGGAPGTRGKIGRKLPIKAELMTWVIGDEEVTNKTAAEVAKMAGMGAAKDLRLKLEALFPDTLPNVFSFETDKGVSVTGRWNYKNSNTADPSVAPEDEDTDDDDDDDDIASPDNRVSFDD